MSQSTLSLAVTDQERQDLRRRMAVQHEIELEMNNLIRDMIVLVDSNKVAESRMEKHQIKNLLGVALETPSVEVVKQYILYQVGRDAPGSSWRRDDFGGKLVKALDTLRRTAERIAQDVQRQLRLGDKLDNRQIDDAWILLVRAYLGQLNRYFYYRREERHGRG